MPYYISPPPMNPLSRLLTAIVAVLALAGAFFFGIFVLVLAAGLGLGAWLFLSLRMWWLRRNGRVARGPATGPERGPGPGSGGSGREVIDAEYTVISRRDEDS